PRGARIELSFRDARGRWSAWAPAGAAGHAPDGRPNARLAGRIVGEPLWSGGTTEIALRADRTVTGARVHALDVSGGAGARRSALLAAPLADLAAMPLALPALAAGPGQPRIIA